MKTKDCKFRIGELYAFGPSERWGKSEPHIWGLFDKRGQDGTIHLEVATENFIHFRLWVELPKEFCYCRLASRTELRDFGVNVGTWQAMQLP